MYLKLITFCDVTEQDHAHASPMGGMTVFFLLLNIILYKGHAFSLLLFRTVNRKEQTCTRVLAEVK